MYQYKDACYPTNDEALKMWIQDNCPVFYDQGIIYCTLNSVNRVDQSRLKLDFNEFNGLGYSPSTTLQTPTYTTIRFEPCGLETDQILDLTGWSFLILIAAFGLQLMKRALR